MFFCLFVLKGFFLLDALEAVGWQFSGRFRFFSFKFLKTGNFGQWFFFFFNRIQHSWISKICGTLKHKTIKWLFIFWIWQIHWKQNEGACLLGQKKYWVVSRNCARKFIWCYPGTWLAVATSWDLHYTLRKWSQ